MKTTAVLLLKSHPFWLGWGIGMGFAFCFHAVQWWKQANIPVDDRFVEIGWPFTFHAYGGFASFNQYYYAALLGDLCIWSLLSLIPAALTYFASRYFGFQR